MSEHNTWQATIERLDEAIAKLTQSHHSLSQNQTALSQAQHDMNAKMDSLLEPLVALTPIPSSPTPPSSSRPHMKLEVPCFDGSDPMGWIFKITRFFDYQNILDQEKLIVAGFYMEGAALTWYQWMYHNGFLTTWPALLQALESHFALSFYDDPHGALFKLQQRGTVKEYLTEFERLANRTVGLAPPFLLSCFILGLLSELRHEVQALQPLSLPQAIALARLQEDKLHDRRCGPRPFSLPPQTVTLPTNPYPLPSTKLPFKRLSSKEMAVRRDKGLCYTTTMTSGLRATVASHPFISLLSMTKAIPQLFLLFLTICLTNYFLMLA